MNSCSKTYTINEYCSFTRGVSLPGYKALPHKTFDSLELFILANRTSTDNSTNELLSISSRPGVGKIITARNYVGIITMNDGTAIEILPKISGQEINEAETKKIFLEMLKTLRDVTFKDFDVSHLNTEHLSLFEIFIEMFLDEITALTKQGLKFAYTPLESNERFYKGRLLSSQNITHNLVHKERFFVRYDDFNKNRPENSLIKSTLRFIYKVSENSKNRMYATRLLGFFDDVKESKNYRTDLSKCFIDRSMTHYNKAISWCRIFLLGNSFTAFSGREVALALLFPMEKVFENFIAAKLRKSLHNDFTMKTQDTTYCLFDCPTPAFSLRPDIVLEKNMEYTVILDTKWKILSDHLPNKGISQSDMYQMYVYSKKYNADKIILVYPLSGTVRNTDIVYTSNDKVKVEVFFVDLRNVNGSIVQLANNLN